MARRLINRNRNSEQRQQSLLLDRLTVRFRGRVRRAIASAMRDMINHWEQTSEVVLPRGYVDQIETAYHAMAAASISEFAKRITGQAKSENIPLEIKESFAETMTRWAFDYIRAEMVRRRITSIAETTRQQVVNAIDRGFADGLGQAGVATYVRGLVPEFSRYRAEMIARTETHGAANYGAGRAARETNLPLNREWIAASDERTRETHTEADGQIVGMDEPFTVGGASLMYPGDPDGPAEEVINCFHPSSMILGAGIHLGIRRHYVGQLIKVSLGGPINLTVTPNHPVLTKSGWVAAGKIVEGDDLVYCGVGYDGEVWPSFDIDNGYSRAEELYGSGDQLGFVGGAGCEVMDFHGEMVAEQVDIVTFNRSLRDRMESAHQKTFGQLDLSHADIISGDLLALRMVNLSGLVPANEANSIMRGGGSGFSVGLCGHGRSPAVSFGNVRPVNANFLHDLIDARPRDAGLPRNAVNRVALLEKSHNMGMIGFADHFPPFGWSSFKFRKCTFVETFHYVGPVYNFESDNGILVSNGIVNHNCRCSVGFIVDESRLFD